MMSMLPSLQFGFDRPDYLWLLLLWLPIAALFTVFSRRKLAPWRRALALGMRTLLLLAIVLALAGLTRKEPIDALGVVFVMDRSASVGGQGHQDALDFVGEALAHQQKDDVAGVVVFGHEALVEAEVRDELRLHGIESVPSPHQTDIAAGIRLGTALLPADRTRRIVVLTDGEQTRGDATAQTLLTAGDDLDIGVVAIGGQTGPEVLLEDLLMPPRVDEGAAYDLRVVARSEVPADGILRIYRNDDYLGEMKVHLEGGGRAAIFPFRQEARAPGLYRYRAVLDVPDASQDTLPQNNEVVSTIQVSGRPRVLFVEGYEGQGQHLRAVLEAEDLQVDQIRPEDVPPGLAGLRPYAAVILSDVPAFTMTRRQQEAMRSFVRDLGRGLVMVGGDQSFGVGGYYRSPIEDALPVNMDIQDKTRFPKLGMVLAIDKSCSMGGGQGSKLALAREAAIETAELLSDRDMIGVIGFDSAASWIVNLQELGGNRDSVVSTISSIRPGGGTDIYPALNRAIKDLDSSDAALKHVILLSDGMTSGADFEGLIRPAHARGITVTAVAIGNDADRHTMQQFASWGGGNYYLVTDPTSIPSIFTRETLLATRSFLIEEPFKPAFGAPSDILRGMKPTDFPTFLGFVGTDPKKRATVAMYVPDDKEDLPLLAHWRYGLGRSVAFTSDAKPRWSQGWVGTESYTRFWSQVARWTVGDPNADNLSVDAEIREGELIVTVDAFDTTGGFKNFLDGEARVVAPDLAVHPLELRQVAPGRYQAAMPVDQDGSWLVGVALKEGGETVGQAVAEAVQPYSPEYRSRGAGTGIVEEMGRLGGLGVLTDPAEVFSRPEVARHVPRPLWPALMALAAFLLVADVAVRRLDLSWRRPGELMKPVPAAQAPVGWQPPKPVQPKSPGDVVEVDELEEEPKIAAKKKLDIPEDSYAGRLLAARRKARKRTGDEE